MTDCVFCDIVTGAAPARQIYADDHVVAFLDIRPIMRGHTLVVPRTHSDGLADLGIDDGARMWAAGRRIAAAMKVSDLGVDGINLALNDGSSAFQTVFHTHLHVLPRADGDRIRFVRGLLVRRDPNPDETAAILREAMGTLP
ncbi:HIT domain-containing protein [Gordonia sp. VNQ95]|jgi:diadenosine tetraphosphate (Ap4A) HIT family hydrolase|uniref:HIT family protein n=1 Tax=Gordonia TaxID=2053 RepID=UPI0032B5E6F9